MDKAVLKSDLGINQIDINEEIARQPGLFVYYADQARLEEEKLKRLKLAFDVFEAALDGKIRDLATARREKLTENQISMAMRRNDDWVRRKHEIITVESGLSQIEAVVKAMYHKKDMLVAMSANIRQDKASGFGFNSNRQHEQQVIPTIKAPSTG